MTTTKEVEKNLNFKGIVVPSDWDDEGNPVGFDLSTYNEEHYRLVIECPLIKIKPFIHEQVEVMGRLRYYSDYYVIIIHRISKCPREHLGN